MYIYKCTEHNTKMSTFLLGTCMVTMVTTCGLYMYIHNFTTRTVTVYVTKS